MIEKKWSVREVDAASCQRLAADVPCSPLVARLLIGRGVRDVDAARRFLDPRLTDLHEPLDLPGMEQAVGRIALALERREPIAVFGDYDADGISSTCLLLDFFRFIGHRVRYRLPHRLSEGYGLRCEAVRELAAEGIRLIITVDNGSSAREEVDLARKLGIDVVITDHHQPPDELPAAVALVNPWLAGSRYPFKDLAGVGVTFKLIWALSQRLSRQKKLSGEFRRFLLESLALVALGTISDVVPLLGENRVFARFGLRALEETSRPGLRRLVESGLKQDRSRRLEAAHIGFRLGPRINAAGRLGRAETAMDLLLAEEDEVAVELVRTLEGENRRRQEIEREMFVNAREQVLKNVDLERSRAIVLESEGWHTGVIGIVAARIAQEFSRPTLLIAVDGERGRGSARSIPGVHICNALAACSRFLAGYGGHEMAAGVEVEPRRIEELRNALNEAIVVEPAAMIPEVEIDAEVRLPELGCDLIRELERLEPFGHGNREPLLAVRSADVVGRPRLLGDDGRHVSFHVRQDGVTLRAIAFGQGERLPRLTRPDARVSLIASPRISRWQGQAEVELNVREIR